MSTTATIDTTLDDPLRRPAIIGRTQVARRAQRVLDLLLAEHRQPAPACLPTLLAPLTGGVLAAFPLDKPDRAASMKIAAAAASYCWDFLPDLDWDRVDVALSDATLPPPLVWADRSATVVADVLLAGQHRSPEMLGRRVASDLLAALEPAGVAPVAVRVLTLTTPATSLLITPAENFAATALTSTRYATIGGVWR